MKILVTVTITARNGQVLLEQKHCDWFAPLPQPLDDFLESPLFHQADRLVIQREHN